MLEFSCVLEEALILKEFAEAEASKTEVVPQRRGRLFVFFCMSRPSCPAELSRLLLQGVRRPVHAFFQVRF